MSHTPAEQNLPTTALAAVPASPPATAPSPTAPRVALVGVHGHGRSHLRNILRLGAQGTLVPAGLVDPRPLTDEDARGVAEEVGVAPTALDGVPRHRDLEELLDSPDGPPDVVVLCTPIHTHTPLATRALEAGCDVLLEKPPTASAAEHETLLAVERRTGRRVQVGFQTFGSGTLPVIHRLVADGEIGEVTGVGGVGTWVRPLDYWTRSAWTGRRSVDGRPVVDGVVTNPLAHAVATALHLAGATRSEDVARVELDQYRANDIEVDDTSAVRITTSTGVPVSLGLTLCAAVHTAPAIVVQGTRGRAVLDYYADTVEVVTGSGRRLVEADRTDLLTDLLRHRVDGRRLLCALEDTGAFVQVLDAVRSAPDPRAVDPRHVTTATDSLGTHLVVDGVEDWCRRVAEEHATFAELGAPWTTDDRTGGPR